MVRADSEVGTLTNYPANRNEIDTGITPWPKDLSRPAKLM
jgi:hypothetical protein